ncbi:ATP phosphoribosyltransferase regulatory subunit [Heyndrickxia oleronia]|uniref:ATP phosphoribosyltransferase regulatory subunit n=1 Tax=Heyndrickxia oleronia TaxID=38875 RepID=UPI00090333D6|nr:ATP phosphoribosyltransferase regulatory subunit [Heyndrickxia oleronia]MCM3453358.1 ATP phosphoribosyltransferase regulatory subunit [Heyndrickxia oleronia]NYV65522.1 ATP phosphoribosyltransferase regulatory subunit [Bacillus sp. Gen3]OJH20547.1 ATP phosphoribosyltransferase regulatory subunit [Bacillus obstructivus]
MFLPSGSKDMLGSRVSRQNQVFETFRQVVTLRGYQEIATPVVEYASTFTNEYVGMPLQNMLKWFNSDGEIEVLRPDWTTAIARAIAKHSDKPQKWAYQGSIFRRNKLGVEGRQVGIEIINYTNLLAESECLFMARNFLNELKISEYITELAHTGIFEELSKQLNLSENDFEQLRLAMHDKRKDTVYQIAKNHGNHEIADEFVSLVDAYGNFESVIEMYEIRWKNNATLLNILGEIKRLSLMLQSMGETDIIVDLGRVKNLPYYSGMMFRGFLKENGATCYSGGRYDKLYEQFEQSISAVGLAFDADQLAEQIQVEKNREKICVIATEKTYSIAEQLRERYKDSIIEVLDKETNLDVFDKVLKIIGSNGDYEVIEK